MRITWSPRARSLPARSRSGFASAKAGHLIALRAYIAARNPAAAVRVGQRIEEAVRWLAEFPFMGRPGRIEDTRELVITRTPYIVAYTVAADEVAILAVMHGAQRWPESL